MNKKNPFELVTASKLTAAEAIDLWCDDKRLDRVNGKENCFINGHRGTGKSMLFRILQHDCQSLLNPDQRSDFLAVYFSVRDTEFLTEELDIFQSDAQKNIISESHFSLLITKQLFLLLGVDEEIISGSNRDEFIELTAECFENAFQYSSESFAINPEGCFSDFLTQANSIIEKERVRITTYIGLRLYDGGKPFEGPLFLFDAFLGRIADFFSSSLNQCLYFLIDDGDDLPESHTIVLNSWIARRRESAVFKVSTMFGYKTYETKSRSAIQHPHDFFQYDIGTRYMSNSAEDYVSLLRNICEKRLRSVGIETAPGVINPDDFFPEDVNQLKALNDLSIKLNKNYEKIYNGRAIKDHVYRHLTSEYMKELRQKHSPDSFIYSGFRTLAVLSSGHVRDFIICAQRMFDNASRSDGPVTCIRPSIQNEVVREHADDVLAEIQNPKQKRIRDATNEDWHQVSQLILGISNLFKAKMLSGDSERRVFSFSVQNDPSPSIEKLLNFAVAEGYLMKGFISRKEGTGRRALYVLTRRLGPAFNLDVSAYSGYLSLSTGRINHLIKHGEAAAVPDSSDSEQLTFFELENESDSNNFNNEKWVFITPEEAGL